MSYEVIIIGGGPAGASAAILLARGRRKVLLLDSGYGRNRSVDGVHLLLSREGVSPERLRDDYLQQMQAYPNLEVSSESVVEVAGNEGAFVVHTAGQRAYEGSRILLATGLEDQLPEIDGLENKWGQSAFLCPYCDGWEVRDRPMSVLVSAPEDLPFAMMLTRWSTDLTVLTEGKLELGEGDRKTLQLLGASVNDRPITAVTGPGAKMETIVFDDGSSVPSAVMFLHTRTKQRSDIPELLGCNILEDGCVEVDYANKTKVPGVSAAGDMARPVFQPVPIAYVAAAASDGLVAAGFIDADLFGASFKK